MYELQHPGIIKLLGYCVRDSNPVEVNINDPLSQHGVVAVYEYGENFQREKIQSLPGKLMIAEQLADLLDYMEHSPLGSLTMLDPKADNFKLVDGRLKVSDIDLFNAKEPLCSTQTCHFNITCQNGRCAGYNAKRLFRQAYGHWHYCLQDNGNEYGLSDTLLKLRSKAKTLAISAGELKVALQHIITSYHLRDKQSDITTHHHKLSFER